MQERQQRQRPSKRAHGLSLKWIILPVLALVVLGCQPGSGEQYGTRLDLKAAGAPETLQRLVGSIEIDSLGGMAPKTSFEKVDNGTLKVQIEFTLKDTLVQDDWQVVIKPGFRPDFHWSPHLTPTADHIIPQHVFRAPALIMSEKKGHARLVVLPDLETVKAEGPKWYMDLDAQENEMVLGHSRSRVGEHVLYLREGGTVYPPGTHRFSFFVRASDNAKNHENPWRDLLAFQWERYGRHLYEKGEPFDPDLLGTLAARSYQWAFDSWKDVVWQEFDLNGKRVGAPTFIVNVSQSPNYEGPAFEREFQSIWNQAWFSSLRSASGLYRHARRNGDSALLEKALMTKELALSFPQDRGFFPGIIATEMEEVVINGQPLNRSKGWEHYYFGNSNRNPFMNPTQVEGINWGSPKYAPYHILDMSWTANQMLHWYTELEKDPRLLDYATAYAGALLKLQDEKGYFPGWISKDELRPMGILDQGPESAMSASFLINAYRATGEQVYKDAALRTVEVLIGEVIPQGRWEDFETYWSCSSYGNIHLVGKKVERNNMYKQNNFSMFWTAQALLDAHELTGDKRYLSQGQRVLDELLMTQATWQPPYMYVRTLGGFGVMNADAEWNDARQSLFSELIIKYGKALGSREYLQRGLAALRASFVMMYCPENPRTQAQWEARHPFFGEEDHGFMMENYGHNGTTSREGLGIGDFTIYDWGNGAASEAYNRILDHHGKDFLEGR